MNRAPRLRYRLRPPGEGKPHASFPADRLHQQRGDAAGAAAHASAPACPACGRCAPPRRRRPLRRAARASRRCRRRASSGPTACRGSRLRLATGRCTTSTIEIAAAEEHQPAPIRMRTVERHVEAEPRAVERGGALGIRRSRPRHGPSPVIGAVAVRDRAAGAPCASSRKNSRTPRVASVAARVRFQHSVAPDVHVAAFDLGDRIRLQRQPIEPAVHLGDVADAEADAGQPLALIADHACGCGPRRRRRRPAPSVPASCCRA